MDPIRVRSTKIRVIEKSREDSRCICVLHPDIILNEQNLWFYGSPL